MSQGSDGHQANTAHLWQSQGQAQHAGSRRLSPRDNRPSSGSAFGFEKLPERHRDLSHFKASLLWPPNFLTGAAFTPGRQASQVIMADNLGQNFTLKLGDYG